MNPNWLSSNVPLPTQCLLGLCCHLVAINETLKVSIATPCQLVPNLRGCDPQYETIWHGLLTFWSDCSTLRCDTTVSQTKHDGNCNEQEKDNKNAAFHHIYFSNAVFSTTCLRDILFKYQWGKITILCFLNARKIRQMTWHDIIDRLVAYWFLGAQIIPIFAFTVCNHFSFLLLPLFFIA